MALAPAQTASDGEAAAQAHAHVEVAVQRASTTEPEWMPVLSSSPAVVAPTRRQPLGSRSRTARLSAPWSRSREANIITSLG